MSATGVNPSSPSLPELIARLQAAKFAIATSEVLDAARLLAKLAENNTPLQADFLRGHLRPLLCKSTDRQAQQLFDDIFRQWWEEQRRIEVGPVTGPVTPPEEPKPKHRVAVLLVILFLALVLLYWQRRPEPELTDANPAPSMTEQKKEVSKPVKAEPNKDKTQEPTKPESPRIYGYWPAYRYTETLRPALAWLLVGAPLLLLLFFNLPAWALSRRRSGGGSGIMLKGWERDLAAQRLVKPLPEEVASRFDWHIRGPAEETRRWSRRPSIDVARTVSATLASIGIPKLRYRHARLHPEYLVLVEADHDDDFAMLWAGRLKKQGLAVDLRRLIVPKDGSLPYWHKQQTGETGRFDNLPNPSFAQRLIVVSDGGFLLDEQGQWRDWAIAAQLQRWPVRALFSPKEPRDLVAGDMEIKLSSSMRLGDPGFLVLPQEESALAAWSTWLSSGQMPVIVPAEAQRFPRLIAEKNEQHYLSETAPDDAERARLIAELHVYLGENGFYWLCCCAIPPLMRTGLTLLLGEEYLRRAGASGEDKLRYHLARNYRLLIRLPWLRHNHMPDWLRLALLLRLSLPLQEEMRDVVDGLLARQSPDSKGSLPLGFDAPKAGAAVGAGGEHQSTQHGLYLGFMGGLSARQLQLRIPGPWQSWLNRMDSRPHSLRRWRDWLLSGFARLLFRGGLPENGAARFSLLAGWVVTGFSVVLLSAVAVLPPKDWPQPWREVLFVEGAEPLVFRHEGVVRGLAFKGDNGTKGGFRFPWPISDAKAVGKFENFDQQDQFGFRQAIPRDQQDQQPNSPDQHEQNQDQQLKFNQLLFESKHPILNRLRRQHKSQGQQPKSLDHLFKLLDQQEQDQRSKFSDQPLKLLDQTEQDQQPKLQGQQDQNQVQAKLQLQKAKLRDQQTKLRPQKAKLKNQQAQTLQARNDQQLRHIQTPYQQFEPLKPISSNDTKPMLLAVTGDRMIQHWNIQTGALQEQLTDELRGEALVPKREGLDNVVSPDGKLTLVFDDERTLRLLATEQFKALKEAESERKSVVDEIEYIKLRMKDEEIGLNGARATSRAGKGRALKTIEDEATLLNRQLAIADEQLKNIVNQPGIFIGEPLRHEHKIIHAIFSPDSQQIATATEDGTVRVWKAQIGVAKGKPIHLDRSIDQAIYSPDGSRVVTITDKTASHWDTQTGALLSQALHEGKVTQSSYSPDGRRIITGGEDGTVSLRDAHTNALLGVLPAPGKINAAIFHPSKDEVLIARSSKDGEARIWRIPPHSAPKPAFEYVQDHLNTIAIFSILLALLFERVWHISNRHRFNQRLHYYTPGSSDKTAGQLRSAYEKFIKLMRLRRRAVKA